MSSRRESQLRLDVWAAPMGTFCPNDHDALRRMQAARRRDTAPELAIRRALHSQGMRFHVDCSVLPGVRRRVDIVFRKEKVAAFVDGCFWHSCPIHRTFPKSNAAWWAAK